MLYFVLTVGKLLTYTGYSRHPPPPHYETLIRDIESHRKIYNRMQPDLPTDVFHTHHVADWSTSIANIVRVDRSQVESQNSKYLQFV